VDPERARARLAGERSRIERAIASLEASRRDTDAAAADELSHLDQHPADEATDLYDSEFDEGRLEDLRNDLAAVERAERRLAEGTYGLSVESGRPIPEERLEALPTAERTVEEEARFARRA
jgi:DnaK suppressor protein